MSAISPTRIQTYTNTHTIFLQFCFFEHRSTDRLVLSKIVNGRTPQPDRQTEAKTSIVGMDHGDTEREDGVGDVLFILKKTGKKSTCCSRTWIGGNRLEESKQENGGCRACPCVCWQDPFFSVLGFVVLWFLPVQKAMIMGLLLSTPQSHERWDEPQTYKRTKKKENWRSLCVVRERVVFFCHSVC